jgi:surface polysaccharide O-acyltransferase-like enzyme
MLLQPGGNDQATTSFRRSVALDRARTFITLSVLVHHSLLNYTYFGNGDPKRWLGFDFLVLLNDSYFMAFMFLLSGLFVHGSLVRKGPAIFLLDRAWRLGVPYLLSVFVLMPIAYYPTFLRYHLPGTTDFSFLHFWWRTLTAGPWPSGPAWFLWVLLAFDAIAAALWWLSPRAIEALGRLIFAAGNRPMKAFAAFLVISIATYLPMRLAFGEVSWLEFGLFPLPIQTSRVLLYTAYFLFGVGAGVVGLRAGLLAENGGLATRRPIWLGFALLFYVAILVLVYAHHNWIADLDTPPLVWRVGYGLAFAMFSAAMTFTVLAVFLCSANSRFSALDALRPSAYGIYLLHYVFVVWLQYALYEHSIPAVFKFAIVFAGTLSASWALAMMLRKIPAVARMI